MKNYDKILAKYARQIENPKYYEKITQIIYEATKKHYQFKDFNKADLEYMLDEMDVFYEAVPNIYDQKRIIKHCNSNWFIISDKNYILWESESFWIATSIFIRTYLILLYARIRQLVYMNKIIYSDNIDNDIYLVRGAIKTAKVLGCELLNIEDKWI